MGVSLKNREPRLIERLRDQRTRSRYNGLRAFLGESRHYQETGRQSHQDRQRQNTPVRRGRRRERAHTYTSTFDRQRPRSNGQEEGKTSASVSSRAQEPVGPVTLPQNRPMRNDFSLISACSGGAPGAECLAD